MHLSPFHLKEESKKTVKERKHRTREKNRRMIEAINSNGRVKLDDSEVRKSLKSTLFPSLSVRTASSEETKFIPFSVFFEQKAREEEKRAEEAQGCER